MMNRERPIFLGLFIFTILALLPDRFTILRIIIIIPPTIKPENMEEVEYPGIWIPVAVPVVNCTEVTVVDTISVVVAVVRLVATKLVDVRVVVTVAVAVVGSMLVAETLVVTVSVPM